MRKALFWGLVLRLLLAPSAIGQDKGAANESPSGRIDRWTYLMKLIEEEEKTINTVRRKTDSLMYRMFELQNERIKLYKEKENKAFLDAGAKGKKIPRKRAFRKTLRQYEKARRYGLSILKKHPRTRYRAAVYHSLALNSRDYAYDDRELGYLYKAIKHTRKHSETWYLAMTSLAEYFYNDKKYPRAVSLYKQVIHNDSDQWHTKNLYNYGWCLLKTHKFGRAIDRLEEGYKLSFDTRYIDFRDQIMRSLVSFYVLGKEIERGIKFVLENDKSPHEALARFARKTADKGFFSETERLVALAEDRLDKGKEKEQLADLRLFQFDFYNQYKREKKLFAAAKSLSRIQLNEYQTAEAVRKLKEKARVEQIIVKKDFDKLAQAYDVQRLENLKSYFGFLGALDAKNESVYRFYTAETLYSVKEHKESLAFYKQALEIQLKTPTQELPNLNRKIIDGIFSSIDFARLSEKEEMAELEYAYLKYLSLWPKDKKAKKIHQKLFAIYFSGKEHDKMESSLAAYAKAFPGDGAVHRKLFKQRIDLAIKEADTFRLATLVKKMKAGLYSFSKKETKKSEVILANLLFSKFQKMNEAGDAEGAVAGYKKVFYNNHYPQSVKAEAGFNIGILYTDLYEAAKSVKWFKKTFPLFNEKEKAKKREYIEKMSKRSALLQDFLNAAHMQKIVLDNFCQDKKRNSDNLRQAVVFDLANDYVLKAKHTFDAYKECVRDIRETEAAMIGHFFRNGHERSLLSMASAPGARRRHKELLTDYLERLYWRNFQDPAQRSLYRHEIKLLNDKRLTSVLNGVKRLEDLAKEYDSFKRAPLNTNQFNPEKFNARLNERARKLAELIAESKKLLDIQNGNLSLKTYAQMRSALEFFAEEIANYRPAGMPEEFNRQFLAQMRALSNNFEKKAASPARAANELANKYEVIAFGEDSLSAGSGPLKGVDMRMPASLMASTYDLEDK